jgi:hypothetical protein
MLNLRIKIPFFQKKLSLKSLYLVVIYNLTYLLDGYAKLKFMLKILEKIHEGSEPGLGSGAKSATI